MWQLLSLNDSSCNFIDLAHSEHRNNFYIRQTWLSSLATHQPHSDWWPKNPYCSGSLIGRHYNLSWLFLVCFPELGIIFWSGFKYIAPLLYESRYDSFTKWPQIFTKLPLSSWLRFFLTQESPLPWVIVEGATPIDFCRGITFSLKMSNRQVICLQKAYKALFISPVLVLSSWLRKEN